jgi:hypothetical protein
LLTLVVAPLMAAVLISGCTADRCPTLTAGGGPAVEIPSLGLPGTADFERARELPPEVVEAVSRYFAGECHQSVVAARRYSSYILLDVPTCALDGNRHLVFSPERRCIVGSFVWYIQG